MSFEDYLEGSMNEGAIDDTEKQLGVFRNNLEIAILDLTTTITKHKKIDTRKFKNALNNALGELNDIERILYKTTSL
jgi:hypothetical protein